MSNMVKKCSNKNFPHTTQALYKGMCLACYKYLERRGKARPASLIIAHLERTTKANPMERFLKAAKELADLNSVVDALVDKPDSTESVTTGYLYRGFIFDVTFSISDNLNEGKPEQGDVPTIDEFIDAPEVPYSPEKIVTLEARLDKHLRADNVS